tara:strand:+ start:3895 stop:4098 length:204 start_codon:yes stop_codon:yes gene_type:complete
MNKENEQAVSQVLGKIKYDAAKHKRYNEIKYSPKSTNEQRTLASVCADLMVLVRDEAQKKEIQDLKK